MASDIVGMCYAIRQIEHLLILKQTAHKTALLFIRNAEILTPTYKMVNLPSMMVGFIYQLM